MMSPANLRCLVFSSVSLLVMLCFVPAASVAADNGMAGEKILVRSHLPLPGGAVQQMFLQESGGRKYLYVQQAGESGELLVDVTDDRHPKVLKEVALSHRGHPETLQMVGDELGVAARPDTPLNQTPPAIEAISSNTAPQFVRLVDLSNALHPRTLKTFDGVTSMLLDSPHNVIYLANGDGLWILHHRIDVMRQVCEEISEYSTVPLLCTGY
jgi:hypothetical protein